MQAENRELWTGLANCMIADRQHLQRRIQRLGTGRDKELEKAQLLEALLASQERREQRERHLPRPTYPLDLPVVARRADIAHAIAANQVVIICGETGSGKTTQLPKICLELGRGVGGLIGHTQPRRIAARSIAQRLANELQSEVGQAVGYKIRFSDRVSSESYVKLMTDGILLAETQSDRFLDAYDTLIVDEAHERSLNIDFLLGYLKRLLSKRHDLKLIITSATIDTQRISAHFNDAPVIEVAGRSHAVEIRYRPLLASDADSHDRDIYQAVLDGVDELAREGLGDILVFLPGEREIKLTAEALRKHHPPHTEVLPLFSRLSVTDQNKLFQPHTGRRIVLATNVAETSLTVPGIRYVIDTGLARIKRVARRSKIQRLPVEPISRSSANQRAGRCGRTAPGICIRLFDEQDYLGRPEFTEPEILRTNLAAAILQMQALGLGDVGAFPFVDSPTSRQITDGFKLLEELGAVDRSRKLTQLGVQLAKFPVDPRVARMVIAARDLSCLTEVLIIASALSVQDPRERPLEAQQAADEAHQAFRDERSDFLSYQRLWSTFHEQLHHLSQRKLRDYCKRNFLSYVRMQEWRDVHGQIMNQVKDMGWRLNTEAADYAAIHRALLTGLLGNLGFAYEPGNYLGLHNSKFQIFPGSALFKKSPKWIMAGEVVETSRPYARTVAIVDPQWIEPLAKHLVTRSYSEPHWERKHGRVAAFEKVSLGGLTLVQKRRINYSRIDPAECRQVFIRSALVEGLYDRPPDFLRHNLTLLEDLTRLEHKSRRHDIVVSEEALYKFYDARVPAEICSASALEKWWHEHALQNSDLLYFSRADMMRREATEISGERFPNELAINGVSFALTYHFEPGAADDGITLTVPLNLLNQLDSATLDWLVPGLLEEKIVFLLKALPKQLRRSFVPIPDFARACIECLHPERGHFMQVLVAELQRMTGQMVPVTQLQAIDLPPHLCINLRLVDEQGTLLEVTRDLAQLQQRWSQQAAKSFRALSSHGLEQDGLTDWPAIDISKPLTLRQAGTSAMGYPGLVDNGATVDLRVFDDASTAARLTVLGITRLFVLQWHEQVKYLRKHLPKLQDMALRYKLLPPSPFLEAGDSAAGGSAVLLADEIISATVRHLCLEDHSPLGTCAQFHEECNAKQPQFIITANQLAEQSWAILRDYTEICALLRKPLPLTLMTVAADINDQLRHMIYRGFISDTPRHWWPRLPKYLQAIRIRLERAAADPARDKARQQAVEQLLRPCRRQMLAARQLDRADAALTHYRWLLEEFRISLFAQELKTCQPVSAERLTKLWSEISKR